MIKYFLGMRRRRVLTDRGTEYCGKVDHHAFERVKHIDHSKTKARSPQTNGICERFHRTMKNEFYDTAFRKKLYHSLEELQTDVEAWLQSYNELRPHSGRFCYGKTPLQTFKDAAHLAQSKVVDQVFEPHLLIKTPEDDLSVLQAGLASCGVAPGDQLNLEHKEIRTRINELELEAKIADNLLSDF
jgi:Integrase core domain